MSIGGLDALLLTHGVDCHKRLNGITDRYEDAYQYQALNPDDYRQHTAQILAYMEPRTHVEQFVILDDVDIPGFDGRFVRTIGNIGLTGFHARRAIEILR